MNIHIDAAGRDPVAIAIETLLCDMQERGMGAVRKTSTAVSVVLHFGELRSEGRTLDIALVRLANAMMDDAKYTRLIMDTLRGQMKSEAA
jgi:hypothetical protein